MCVNDSTPEDGEPASFINKTKILYGKHKGKILAAGATLGGVALAAVVAAAMQDVEQNATTENAESAADPVARDERRKPPVKHHVARHMRTLADGRVVPVETYERGGAYARPVSP